MHGGSFPALLAGLREGITFDATKVDDDSARTRVRRRCFAVSGKEGKEGKERVPPYFQSYCGLWYSDVIEYCCRRTSIAEDWHQVEAVCCGRLTLSSLDIISFTDSSVFSFKQCSLHAVGRVCQ